MWKHKLNIALIVAVMVFFGLTSLMWWIKPSYSDRENRDLVKFPQFSFATLKSGEFFKQIDAYFSDTFPMREGFMEAKGQYNMLKGVQGEGGIVVEPPTVTPDQNLELPDPNQSSEAPPEESAPPEGETSTFPVEKPVVPDAPVEKAGAVAYVGDTALEIYNFVESSVNAFSDTLNAFAEKVGSGVQVEAMIAPTNTEFRLPASSKLSSDQNKAIRHLYDRLSPKVKSVDAYSKLASHTGEYIYFRTDHHWTQLGAYYGYEALMETEGKKPVPFSDYKDIFSYDGFLGTYYNTSKRPSLAKNPDRVDCYMPLIDYKMTTFMNSEQTSSIPGKVIYKNIKSSNKYLAFTQGDQVLIQIKPESGAKDNVLVIKESYGNALIPWLLPNYNSIHVMDLRSYKGNVQQYIKDNEINKVLICDYIIAASTKSKVGMYQKLLGVG